MIIDSVLNAQWGARSGAIVAYLSHTVLAGTKSDRLEAVRLIKAPGFARGV